MAAVIHGISTQSTTNTDTYASASFTPAANDLLVVFVVARGTVAAGALADSQGLGFTLVSSAPYGPDGDKTYCFVANALAAGAAMTVTFTCTGDAATACNIEVERVSGITRTGIGAIKQSAKTENQPTGTAPAATFPAAALTGNPTLGAVGNRSNPAAATPPTGWTELADSGIDVPNCGSEVVHRDSGFTGTVITWGNNSTPHSEIIVEVDASALVAHNMAATLAGVGTLSASLTVAAAGLPELAPKPKRAPIAPPVSPQLAWALCDTMGRRLADLRDRRGGRVTIALNGARTAQVRLSVEDPAARLAYPLATRLKCWYGEQLIFSGPVVTPRSQAEVSTPDAGTIEVNAVCPSWSLVRAFIQGFAAQDDSLQALIMEKLVEEADATTDEKAKGFLGHGIISGTLESGHRRRDRNYADGKNIWEAMIQLSNVNDGPDFELEPLDEEDGVHAQLNVWHPNQGADKSETVLLQYGFGQQTAAGFTYEPDGTEVCNRATVVGQAKRGKKAPAYVAEQKESMRLFGICERWEALTDTDRMARLQSRAEALVISRAFPIEWFDVTPAVELGGAAYGYARDQDGSPVQLEGSFGVPPRFGPGDEYDYWIGDRIRTDAKVGSIDLSLLGRITDATYEEIDAAGNVMVDLTLSPLQVHADVSGYETEVSVRKAY